MIRRFLYALRFMTIIPIPWHENEDLLQVSRSSGFFPLVGVVIGTCLWGLGSILSIFILPWTVALLQTCLWVFLTGGLHLDGLADTADGLGSRQNRERMLEIMKDSSIGSFAALALIMQIALKIAFCHEILLLNPGLIILIPPLARWGQVLSIRFFPPARTDGMGKLFQDHCRWNEVLIGLCTSLVVCGFYRSPKIFIIFVLHGMFIFFLSRRISRILGGLTGDSYGFICETGESFLLIATVLIMGAG